METHLRIGIVCYPTIGGSGIMATGLGQRLAQLGHEVHFISYQRPVRLNLADPNVYFHMVPVGEYSLFRSPDYTLPLSVKMAEISREYRLDILHAHYAVPHATAALLARQMLECCAPVIVTTLHGTDTSLLGRDPHYRPIIKYSIEASDGITTVSRSLRDLTVANFGIRQPVRVIHNFYDPSPVTRERGVMREALGVKPDEFLLLHMSNLRPIKRVDLILQALAGIRHPRCKLLVLAGGDWSPFRIEADRLGIPHDKLLVRENVWEVADYINACDLGLYASEQESFGLSILETLTYGKPVVATAVGGIPEVVDDGETGFLCPSGQAEALRAACDRMLDDPARMLEMGRLARERIATRFSGDKISREYEGFYRELLSRKR